MAHGYVVGLAGKFREAGLRKGDPDTGRIRTGLRQGTIVMPLAAAETAPVGTERETGAEKEVVIGNCDRGMGPGIGLADSESARAKGLAIGDLMK